MVSSKDNIILGGDRTVSIKDVNKVAVENARVGLSEDQSWRDRVKKAVRVLEENWKEENDVYGVTTGVGDTSYQRIPSDQVKDFPRQLVRMHGCGMGEHLSAEETRAVLTVRLSSLVNPPSCVRIKLLKRICDLLNEGILPLIPEEGSVGASGDLTPLSYVAAVVMGEGKVRYRGEVHRAGKILNERNLEPMDLAPKEALAIMNGTSFMAGLACLAVSRSEYLMKLSGLLTGMTVLALKGNRNHFDERIFEWKPHPGQKKIAHWIRIGLSDVSKPDPGSNGSSPENRRVQDRYSLRCAPHVIGVLADALPWIKKQLKTEINSPNDNPLVDPEEEEILHGGNFYGGHVGFLMDSLKNPVANLSDLMDRQFSQMVDPKTNRGLPANLSGATGSKKSVNHGFKALQISTSAWTAEALKQTSPASVFSRSTESHNQDKVSMGPIASRDCLRILELTEQTAAALSLASVQGIELRLREGELNESDISEPLQKLREEVRRISPFLEEDRALEPELRELVGVIRNQELPLLLKD